MVVEPVDVLEEAPQWEVEEPRPRSWSPVEFNFMVESGLLDGAKAHLSSGQIFDGVDHPQEWTCEQYYQMVELGLVGPDERVELIGGAVLQMSPQKTLHASAIDMAGDAMRAVFGSGYRVRVQLPLQRFPRNEPEPDIAVVRGTIKDFLRTHPGSAELILEISDTTLRFDLRTKASLYASLGVPDYWVADVKNSRLHVLREPVRAPEEPFGHRYTSAISYGIGESVTPLAAPNASIRVEDLVPQLEEENNE